MKRSIYFTLVFFASALAPMLAHAQPYLYDHLYWDAKGTHGNQLMGISGLSYLGKLSPTIPHAVAIGEYEKARLVFNQGVRDTTPQYYFPGNKVVRGNFNGDAYPDFVCHDPAARRITVLLGTPKIDSFTVAVILNGDVNKNEFGIYISLLVADCDSDGYDDIVISDYVYTEDQGHTDIGRILYYRGGHVIDSTPTQEINGIPNGTHVGGTFVVGHVRDTSRMFLVEWGSPGTFFFYRLGPSFNLTTRDTLTPNIPAEMGSLSGGFAVVDVDGDGIEDILLGAANGVLVYKGTAVIDSAPTFRIHRPFGTNSARFGQVIVDVGDITGRGYHSLLVTDPDASLGNQENGAIFLFNMGKGLKDQCTGYARGGEFEGMFGTTAIALGDVNNDGRADFMVGGDGESIDIHEGYVAVFLGDTVYSTNAVREIGVTPTELSLAQNYPNPFSTATMITLDIARSSEVRLVVYDAVGRVMQCPLHARLATGRYGVNIDAASLPNGVYRYELVCDNTRVSRFMSVLK